MTNIRLEITGKTYLKGTIQTSGAKNATLPEMAATILTKAPCQITNVPMVDDVKIMFQTLLFLGGTGTLQSNKLNIKFDNIKNFSISENLAKKTRASILLLGPLLARHGQVNISLPGGCPIGERKVNYHLEGLKLMGAKISQKNGFISAKAQRLRAIKYTFSTKTVTGTENLIMAASLAKGKTTLKNCAFEPEIDDLITLLNKAGASISREDDRIIINGKDNLQGVHHEVIPDRIEAGTFMIAGAFKNNNITIKGCNPNHNKYLIDLLENIGCTIIINRNEVKIRPADQLKPIDINTNPYPDFPTDLQAQMTILLTQSQGISKIVENIFDNRFQHVNELNQMGANIKLSKQNNILIYGLTPLLGATITSTDLRASAALVLAGIIAQNKTIILNAQQLFRGYENMPQKLNQIGAKIKVFKE